MVAAAAVAELAPLPSLAPWAAGWKMYVQGTLSIVPTETPVKHENMNKVK